MSTMESIATNDATAAGPRLPRRGAAAAARAWRRDRGLVAGLAIIALVALVGLLAPLIAPHPQAESIGASLQPPGAGHLFGTDDVGFDVFSRVLYAARVDIGIALAATALSLLVGVPLGILAGYTRSYAGELAARVSDTFQAFPVFIVALGLAAAAGSKASNLVFIVAFLNAPIYFRLARNQTRVLRNAPFVEASVVAGERTPRILVRHVLPNAAGPLLAQASVNAGWALLLTSGLSFVGAGVRPPTAEWGAMIANGSEHLLGGEWWPTVFPGLAIMITVLAFGLVSEAISKRIQGVRDER